MVTSVVLFTEPFCTRATNGGAGQRLYWDAKVAGFGLRVGAKAKAFFVQREVNGKTKRITLGRYPDLKVEEARRLANTERATNRLTSEITLRDAMEMYAGGDDRDPVTVSDFQYAFNKYLPDWLDKPLAQWGSKEGRAEVKARHKAIAADIAAGRFAHKDAKGRPRPHKGRTGKTTANATMRAFRAVWGCASNEDPSLPVCPTVNCDWFKYKPRRAAIPFEDLPKWYAGVVELDDPTRTARYRETRKFSHAARKHFLLVTVLTGLRSNDVKTMRWEDVHLKDKRLHVPDPKGGTDRAFNLPISRRLLALLKERRKAHDRALAAGVLPEDAAPWVFGALSASGHIVDARVPIEGVDYIPHGLRNTFANVGRMAGVNEVHISCLMNHTQPGKNITQMYGSVDVNELRAPAQKIEDAFFAMFEKKAGRSRR